jgi:hypothetical protein
MVIWYFFTLWYFYLEKSGNPEIEVFLSDNIFDTRVQGAEVSTEQLQFAFFSIIFGPMPLFICFNAHKQCILSQLYTTALPCMIYLKSLHSGGIRSGPSVPEANAMSTVLRHLMYGRL